MYSRSTAGITYFVKGIIKFVCVCPSNDSYMRMGVESMIKTSCSRIHFRKWAISNTNFLRCSDAAISSDVGTFLRTMICSYFSFVVILYEDHLLSHDHSIVSVPTCRTRGMEKILSTGFFILLDLIDIRHLENPQEREIKLYYGYVENQDSLKYNMLYPRENFTVQEYRGSLSGGNEGFVHFA